jgi:DNA-binding transcriptional MerR regulator
VYETHRILQLRRQGFCIAAISLRLKVPVDSVRAVLLEQATRAALESRKPESVLRARRAAARDKLAKAERRLAEAQAVLDPKS